MGFDVVKSKVVSTVKLKIQGRRSAIPHGMIIDTGATMTTMSEELFDALGHGYKDIGNIKIIGINGVSKGVSTVIDYFEIGGTNIGPVRVAVGELAKEFRNSIILGMNIMVWYNFALSHSSNKITLVERQFRGRAIRDKFTMKDFTSFYMLTSVEEIEEIPYDIISIRQEVLESNENNIDPPFIPSAMF